VFVNGTIGLKTSYCESVTNPVPQGFAMSSIGGMTERPIRVGRSRVSYSGGPRFKFRPGEALARLFFV
jgi:hypothetical protein